MFSYDTDSNKSINSGTLASGRREILARENLTYERIDYGESSPKPNVQDENTTGNVLIDDDTEIVRTLMPTVDFWQTRTLIKNDYEDITILKHNNSPTSHQFEEV